MYPCFSVILPCSYTNVLPVQLMFLSICSQKRTTLRTAQGCFFVRISLKNNAQFFDRRFSRCKVKFHPLPTLKRNRAKKCSLTLSRSGECPVAQTVLSSSFFSQKQYRLKNSSCGTRFVDKPPHLLRVREHDLARTETRSLIR